MNKISDLINVLFEISTKIRHNHYLEELYNYEEILSKKEKINIQKAELFDLNDSEILAWFNNIQVYALTSLGIAKLTKATLNNIGIDCKIIKSKAFAKRVNFYTNQIIINKLTIDLDLTKNLEYIYYGIFPEIIINKDKKLNQETYLFENIMFEKYIENFKKREKIDKNQMVKLKKLEVKIESKYMSKEFDKFFYNTKFVSYEEFKEMPNYKLNKIDKRVFEIGYIDPKKTIYKDIINDRTEKILKNLSIIDKIWINPKSINEFIENPKLKKFINILKQNDIIIYVNVIEDKSIYWDIEELEKSLKIIFKWKNEILKEIDKIDKIKFLKLNPEINESELLDFLKFKYIYIKLANNLIIDRYTIDMLNKDSMPILTHEKIYLQTSQTIERVKSGLCVCASFALILKSLCQSLSIDVEYISGFDHLNIFHGWNKVKIGNNWYNLDYLWDNIIIFEDKTEPRYLLKSDNNFLYHYPFDKHIQKTRKADKDFYINCIDRNFGYDEIIRYRKIKEIKRLQEIEKNQKRLIKYDRIQNLVKSRCIEININEFKKLIKYKENNKINIYKKYIILNIEKIDFSEIVELKKELIKYVDIILHINIVLNDINDYTEEISEILNKLKSTKYEKYDYIVFCIQNQPEIKYLEEADNEKRY